MEGESYQNDDIVEIEGVITLSEVSIIEVLPPSPLKLFVVTGVFTRLQVGSVKTYVLIFVSIPSCVFM
jgi:hypothetical protein